MFSFIGVVTDLAKRGIPVSIEFDSERGSWYCDLKFDAKSHGHIYEEDNFAVIRGRYGHEERYSDLSVRELCSEFLRCYRMRGFGSEGWLNLCSEESLIQKVTKATTSWE